VRKPRFLLDTSDCFACVEQTQLECDVPKALAGMEIQSSTLCLTWYQVW